LCLITDIQMKQLLILLTICFLACSCATLMNKPTTDIHFRTCRPTTIVYGKDSVKTVKNKVVLSIERSSNPLVITALTDSSVKQITIQPINSFAYTYNLINFGIGMLFEKDSPKRYGYPGFVFIKQTDTSGKNYNLYKAVGKGDFLLHLSFPYINNFFLKPENESIKHNTGFLGFSLGLDYYYRKNKFINFSAGIASDFFLPFPAPVDFEGKYELMSSAYLSLSNNHKLKKFSFGYGISFASNNWNYRDYRISDSINQTNYSVNKSNVTLGFVFSSYYQIGRAFNVGLIYRPSFFSFNTNKNFRYEHLISIDIALKIPLKSRCKC
jgi:hypothetical protein